MIDSTYPQIILRSIFVLLRAHFMISHALSNRNSINNYLGDVSFSSSPLSTFFSTLMYYHSNHACMITANVFVPDCVYCMRQQSHFFFRLSLFFSRHANGIGDIWHSHSPASQMYPMFGQLELHVIGLLPSVWTQMNPCCAPQALDPQGSPC